MEIIDFINKHLGEYKKKGDEYILKYCPFCNGGRHQDKNTFCINEAKKTFICHRGSCKEKGHFNELLEKYNEKPEVDQNASRSFKKQKKYKRPDIVEGELQADALKYAAIRLISPETLRVFGVTQKDNLLVFNYRDQGGQVVFIKYRPIGKITDNNKKSWREPGTMPILFNMNNIDITRPVVITEGEFDAMAIYESGYKNVVSVPSGCKDFEWLQTCWEWLQQVNEFILYGDNDEPGREMIAQLINKLGAERTKVAAHEHKDANEELFRCGPDAILKNIDAAIKATPTGIIRVAEIEPRGEVLTIPTGIKGIDQILEDCQAGELTVWTGKNGAGKSTILGQIILSAINNDIAVFCYSGELTKERFKAWIDQQAAGLENLEEYKNKYGDTRYHVKAAAAAKIAAWYDDKLFLYDNNCADPDDDQSDILKKCEIAARKYNCKLFIIDNLMTADFKIKNNNDYYRAQSEFVGRLVKFAKKYNIHIHLVAHPKKTTGALDKDAIQGTGDITNRADNVIALERADNDNKDAVKFDYDATLTILKNRNTGEVAKLYLRFSKAEKTYFQVDQNGRTHKPRPYSWAEVDAGMYEIFSDNCPF